MILTTARAVFVTTLLGLAAPAAIITPPVVSVAELNPGTTIERDLCLTIAVGMDAAAECGDLRVVHELPSARVLGRVRTPTLFYNSDHAAPHSIVRANVTLPDGVTGLSRVRAILRVNGAPRAQSVYKGSAWPSGGTGRIALGFDASGEATNVFRYTLEVTSFYGTDSSKATVTGDLAVVNRKQSYFGSGWWLAGLDRLVLDPLGNPTMWIGGDGSVRRYRLDTANVWVAPSVDRPDTLKKEGSQYARLLAGGVKVLFDSLGRHVATRATTGQKTLFAYDAAGRLSAIYLPNSDTTSVQDSTKLKYGFIYGPTGILRTVDAPGAGTPRIVTLYSRNGKVDSIGGPDTTKVGFTYLNSTSGRIIARRNRARVTTSYAYDPGRKIASSTLTLASGESIVLKLRAHETVGLVDGAGAGALAPASAFAKLDGPRSDAGDTATFMLDRFGSPTTVRDAFGNETALTKADTRFPALVTKVRYPNGRVVSAAYDDRGNVSSTTDSSASRIVSGTLRYATTNYQWDPRWDNVTSVITPEGIETAFAYDSTTGNRLWQQVGPFDNRRVTFSYYLRNGLLAGVTEPGIARPDSTHYDSHGNPVQTTSALGVRTHISNDAVGRVERINAPVDSGQTRFKQTAHTYDVMDRIVSSIEVAPVDTAPRGPVDADGDGDPDPEPPPPLGSEPVQLVWVQNAYGPEGELRSVSRTASPSAGIGTIMTRYEYDTALRKVKEIAPDGAVDSTEYDLAGNATAVHTRRTDPTTGERLVVRMVYDAMNRLLERRVPQVHYAARSEGIPAYSISHTYTGASAPYPTYPNDGSTGYLIKADTARYAYDLTGQMISAENRDAKVKRSYYANGALRTDTLVTRTVAAIASGGNFTAHVYGTEMLYDLDGRRTELRHPANLAPVVNGVVKDKTLYRYDQELGLLSGVDEVLGNAFTFGYNNRFILSSIDRPGSVNESLVYDDGGRMTSHSVTTAGGALRSATLLYDVRDKVLRRTNSVGLADSLFSSYTAFGHVRNGTAVSTGFTTAEYDARHRNSETIEHDAMGNQTSLVTQTTVTAGGNSQSTTKTQGFTYESGTGRLLETPKFGQTDTIKYDGAGNEIFHRDNSTLGTAASYHRDRASYYSAEGKLAAAESRYIETGNSMTAAIYTRVFEEFRYDALGRRIWSRSRNWCERDQGGWDGLCRQSKLRRMVWDGDEELYEIQMPGADSSTYLENDTAQVVLPSYAETGTRIDPNRFYGRVAYTHALGIDQPIAITRMGYADRVNDEFYEVPFLARAPFMVSPLWNERGQMYAGTFASGDTGSCQAPSGAGADTLPRCIHFGSSASWFAYERPKYKRSVWQGSLVEDRAEESGILYRRNRYYDPEKGKFTQEDPIGLGGGVNLYGFAAGDPVNFSDPFGLCPQWLTGRPCPGAVDAGVSFVPGVSTGVDFATLVSGRNPLTGENVGWIGRGFALAGVLTPVGGGQIRGTAKAIAEGHAFIKHVLVRGEFAGLGIRTQKQFGQFVDDIMENASGANVRKLAGGRTAYWDDATGTVVIHNPRAADQGTAFRPAKGREYFENDLR